jgi:hypothetical protein
MAHDFKVYPSDLAMAVEIVMERMSGPIAA